MWGDSRIVRYLSVLLSTCMCFAMNSLDVVNISMHAYDISPSLWCGYQMAACCLPVIVELHHSMLSLKTNAKLLVDVLSLK